MIKKCLLSILFISCSLIAFADHIKGGWMYYEYLGPSTTNPANRVYKITAKVYRDCSNIDPNHPQNSSTATFTIFAGTGTTIVKNINDVPRVAFYPLKRITTNPCMTNPPTVCYYVLQYELTIELPATADGYTVAYQRCCRISGIQNLQAPTNQWGNTYTVRIPGTTGDATFPNNNSAKFVEGDTAVICYKAPFTLNYNATDADMDSLAYSICGAIHGGSSAGGTGQGVGASPDPAGAPPYVNVGYQPPYSGTDPFATGIVISDQGIITGNAPAVPGEYVISVCVDEYRHGTKINTVHKELHVIVGDCTLAGASLKDSMVCKSNTVTLQNLSPSTGVNTYLWNFGDPGSGAANTSTSAVATHAFSDSGVFKVKLKVTNTQGCQDSAEATYRVYPLFKADFSVTGNCFQSPFHFADGSTATYGSAIAWHWDFGEAALSDDTANIKNPSYQYASAGTRNVSLVATSSKGCIDSISKPVLVRSNPLLTLPFKDTLICSIDQLPLIAQGIGNFSWTSVPNDPLFVNRSIPNPIVTPKDTTLYIVTLNDNGCVKTDTITVNVLDYITVDLGPDTSMCKTDTIVMKTNSYALSYLWSPAAGLSSTSAKFPKVSPDTTTTYYVKANLGLCPAYDTITIRVAPYPNANAGADKTICYGDKVQLSASYVGTGYAWSPTSTLQNPTSLTPYAGPMSTTMYVFTAFSQGICPKPKSDTIIVTVRPKVNVFAGNDTAVVAMQPLQFNATGATYYTWAPSFGLSATNIGNPVATLPATIDSIIYRVRGTDSAGCFGEDDVKVIVYKIEPDILVPTAFTPNGDGLNDIERPVLIGMQQLNYFRIYNRWGQMVYSTSEIGKGWDGTLGGKPQPSGTYVFAAEAVNYKGVTLMRKGTVVLIR